MTDFGAMFNNEIEKLSASRPMPNSSIGADKSSRLQTLKTLQAIQTNQVKNNGELTVKDAHQLVQLLSKNSLPEFNQLTVSMLLNLNNTIMDAVALDLLSIISAELGGNAIGIDFSFLSPLMQKLDAVIRESPNRETYTNAFVNVLTQATVTDPDVQKAITTLLNKLTQSERSTQASLNNEPIANSAPNQSTVVPPSATIDVLGASNLLQIPGLDGLDGLVFDDNASVIQSKDKAIKIKQTPQNGIIADIELHKDERIVGHAKAFGSLNNMDVRRITNPYISAIVQIGKIQPLFFISEVASQMLVQIGDVIGAKDNLYKVAILTDNVVSLKDIDPVDYIRKVPPSDQPHYAIYEKYRELYQDGYHMIISMHLNPNLSKSYSAALEAKEQVLAQNIDDLDIHVLNTNANGVGLGAMISELVNAIQSNYSPLEVIKMATQLIKGYRHWVCPLEYDFIKNHDWAMTIADTQEKVQMRLFHFTPVVELDKKLSIINVSYSKAAAFTSLLSIVESAIKHRKTKVTRICVEYRGVFRDAIKLRNQIKVKSPNTKVTLQSVGSLTTQFFGPELVGICII